MQFLRNQPKPECCASRNWVCWQNRQCLGEALQGFDGKHHHHCPRVCSWCAAISLSHSSLRSSLRIHPPFAGYWVSILTIEKLGRKWIQIQGFLMSALFRSFSLPFSTRCQDKADTVIDVVAILAGRFHSLAPAPFVVCFSFLQVGDILIIS